MPESGRLPALLEHVQDLVVVLDGEGTVQYANPTTERALGWPSETLVGGDAFDIVHPDDREATRSAFEAAIDAGERRTVQHRNRTADDDWVWFESVVDGVYDDRLDGYVVSSRDVTARRRAERERRRTRERLEELTERAQDVLWMFTADWSELLFVNDAYETIYGGSIPELHEDAGQFLDYVHPDDRDDVEAAMARLSGGESVDVQYRVNPGEDYGRWVWVQGEPIVDDGEVVRVVGFSRDVTERVEYRRQLRVMDRVLRHNLHNDMNVVLGYAEQALDDCEGKCAEDLAAAIEHGGDLLRTVDKQRELVELLDPVPSREAVDLSAVVRDAVQDVGERFPSATVLVDVPPSARVEAVEEIERAVLELVENAVKHADDGDPEVEVAVREGDDRTTLEVADDGPGIPDQEIAVLTGEQEVEPLYHGSGLGLWLVNLVVRRSDGDLAFDPEDPDGSRVTVTLARADG